MSQHYSEPSRESDAYALPDIETFYMDIRDFQDADRDIWMYDRLVETDGDYPAILVGWYWQACFPGCLPDSDPMGPFDTEADAVADAQESAEEY